MRVFLAASLLLWAGSALAQPAPSYAPPNTPNGARPGNIPGTMNSLPRSNRASNIGAGDTRSELAPNLPTPNVGPDAPARAYLLSARQALASGQTGMAQEALERAESRMLDRSVLPQQRNAPDQNPAIQQIAAARRALAAGDTGGAMQAIDSLMRMGR